MNILVYAPNLFNDERSDLENFIVETLFGVIRQHSEHKFFIIANKETGKEITFSKNTELISISKPSRNPLLKKVWEKVKFPAILKRAKADLLISFDNFSSSASVPQCVVFSDLSKVKPAVKKAQLLIVMNESVKKLLIDKIKVDAGKISIIYPIANKIYKAINNDDKEHVKTKYSDGKEFFLYNSVLPKQQNFVDLLKSFSYFKKRQQSNFRLLLLVESNSFFDKSLGSYKYREDVKLINANNNKEKALITAAAYAVVLPFKVNDCIMATLNAMQAGVPVIATKDSLINEIIGKAVLYAGNEIKDIGEKMMQLYKDENHHSLLIEKGKATAATFTQQKAADLMWQVFMKALH
jgi:glycosyltransferase involved in cell wall biosynthesis